MANAFSRRSALLRLASIPITLPLVRSLRAAAAEGGQGIPRLLIFMCNNGTKRGNFWPNYGRSGAGPSYPIAATGPEAPPIMNALLTSDCVVNGPTPGMGKTDNGLLAKTNMLRGLTVTSKGNGGGNQHDTGFARMFTGVPLINKGSPFGGGISLDQQIAIDWGTGGAMGALQTLTTSVHASIVQAGPKPGFPHRLSFSYLGPGTLKVPYLNPIKAYQDFFPATAADPSALRQLSLRKSVLDAVTGDLQEIQGRLGNDDKMKLNYHLSAVRGAETRLTDMISNHGACAFAMTPKDYEAIPPAQANNLVNTEALVSEMIDVFAGLISAALRCNLARIASLQFGWGGGKWALGWLGINLNHHDSIAHRDGTDAPTNQPVSNQVTKICQWYASVIQKVCVDLNNAKEGGGTMLDNTLVIWATELGRGDHNMTDAPIVFLGRVGNGISKGNRVLDWQMLKGGQTDHTVMGYHALNALGIPAKGWGDSPDLTGTAFPGF